MWRCTQQNHRCSGRERSSQHCHNTKEIYQNLSSWPPHKPLVSSCLVAGLTALLQKQNGKFKSITRCYTSDYFCTIEKSLWNLKGTRQNISINCASLFIMQIHYASFYLTTCIHGPAISWSFPNFFLLFQGASRLTIVKFRLNNSRNHFFFLFLLTIT